MGFVVKYSGWLVPTSDGFESESDDEEKGKKREVEEREKDFSFYFPRAELGEMR